MLDEGEDFNDSEVLVLYSQLKSELGKYKTVMAYVRQSRHTQDSQGKYMAHTRQSRTTSGTCA